MLRRLLTICIVIATLPALVGATLGTADPLASDPAGSGIVRGAETVDAADTDAYIVQFVDPPLATYDGSIDGLAATSPRALGTTRLDTDSAASRAYLAFLDRKHAAFELAVEQALGRTVDVMFDYRHAFNGLAVDGLTLAEAHTVATLPGVLQVQRDYERELLSDNGPSWIGAPEMWSGAATPDGSGATGEGVVVGVIDTGINHDHPSFADVGGDGYDHTNPRGEFYGLCDPFTGAPFCNDKLIGVWDFTGTTPLDHHGHGSHTASTAAGNVVDATIEAPTTELQRDLSGVAPHANLITYKVCITSCPGVSLTAAINQAVADEVDVINYSIGGGSSDPWNDSDAQAFLAAREAGVFVATSAGNSGPKAETIGSPADAPWVLSVGASTHDRAFVNTVADMEGGLTTPPDDIVGKSFTGAYGPAPIVHASDYGDDGQCLNPFPPGTWDGEIVICDRGTIARVDKGTNVATGGAGGLVLSNTAADGESTVADPHVIPAVHIGYSDAQVLEAWVLDGGEGHVATIAGTVADVADENGDVMASFSSRGPNPAVPGVIKPDVTAPGVDILAALDSTDGPGARFGLMSGTSMSSPHAAGAAALVRQVHPDWTPAEVQSAITMTAMNAGIRDSDESSPAGTFAFGGGRIDLGGAALAGFVLDESAEDYVAAEPAEGGDPTTLNLATLGYDGCEGTCTWTRTLRSTVDHAVTYHIRTEAPRGVKLTTDQNGPLTIGPGETVELTITADLDRKPVGKWLFGEIRLEPQDGSVAAAHLPVAIRPGTTEELHIEAADTEGSVEHEYTAPIDIKNLNIQVSGLTEGVVDQILLPQDPNPLDPYDTELGTYTVLLDVPDGSRVISAATGETTSQDLDLFIGKDDDGDGQPDAAEELCASTSATAVEACNLVDPEGGTYWVMVQNWLSGRGVDDVELIATVIPGADAGNLLVTSDRTSADAGETLGLTVTWDEPGLEPGTNWFGLVEFGSQGTTTNDVGALLVRLSRDE